MNCVGGSKLFALVLDFLSYNYDSHTFMLHVINTILKQIVLKSENCFIESNWSKYLQTGA